MSVMLMINREEHLHPYLRADMQNLAFYGHSCTWGNGFGEEGKEGKGKRPFSPFPLFPPPQTYFPIRKCLYSVWNVDIMFLCLCFLPGMQWNLSLSSLALLVHGN